MGSNPPSRMGTQCLVVQAAKDLLLWDGGRSLPEGKRWMCPPWVDSINVSMMFSIQ